MTHHALEVYCSYLNGWQTAEGFIECHTYTPADFLHSEYGFARAVIRDRVGRRPNADLIWVLEVSDGDEGGPATLTLFWDCHADFVLRPGHKEKDDQGNTIWGNFHHVVRGWYLNDAVQEFDTSRNFFIQDGNIRGPMTTETKGATT